MRLNRNWVKMGVHKNWVGAVRRSFRFRGSSDSLKRTSSIGSRCTCVGAVRRRLSTKSSPKETMIVFHHSNNSESFTNELEEEENEMANEEQILDSKEVALIVFHHTNDCKTFKNVKEEKDNEKTKEEQILNSKEVVDGDDGDDAASEGSFSSFQELSLLNEDLAAIKIQAFFRAHLARRAYQALRTLVKLQALVRGFKICC